MKLRISLLAIATALGAISCGETTAPPGQTANPTMTREDPTATPDRTVPQVAGPSNPKSNAPRNDEDAPPKDARYTLFCDVIRGPDHVIRAAQIKAQLIQTTHSRAWHLIHTDDQSSLFFGYYRTFDDKQHDPGEFARAQGDHRWISEMKNSQGDLMFRSSMFLPLNNPDPEAPPQWNLAATPRTAFWSLQIGAYRGSPERKQYAVDAVRGLRAQGIEAYYFHGEEISSVCVGTWPIEAIKKQESDSARTFGSSEIPLVVNTPLPDNFNPKVKDREGNELHVQAPKLEILDPTLLKAIHDYPEHAVNGEVLVRQAKNGMKLPSPSFLVQVPHPEGSTPTNPDGDGIRNGTAINGADQAAHDIIDNPTGPSSGHGRLRSIDQK
jgi:hypothetical protein